MEEFLVNLLDNSEVPILSAFILGLLTAISPCPMATNITAVGYISKDIDNKNRVFTGGLIYTLGRTVSYFGLAMILYFGASQFHISGFFQEYGEKIIGPLLLVIGIYMLGVIRINIKGFGDWTQRLQRKGIQGFWDVFLMGIVFALAFCPYAGILYFGMLIPMTISSASGLVLPIVFAIATGIPVIIFAWLIDYSLSEVGSFYNRLKTFEKWFRKVIAVVFIGFGLYYIFIFFI